MKAALLLLAAVANPIPDRLPPVDQCAADASFQHFRVELQRVIEAKDAEALANMLAADVQVDFGGTSGKAEFARTWGLDHASRSQLWDELRRALAYGCAKDGNAFVMPSLSVQSDDTLDPFETLIALPGTKLREQPDDAASEVATLDWHVLRVTESTDVAPWSGVTLVDGRKGFVNGEEVLTPLGYRLFFERNGGEWLITAFVAGD